MWPSELQIADSPTLAEVRREVLGIRCRCLDCFHGRVLSVDQLIARRGSAYPWYRVVRKLRCSRCGSKTFDLLPDATGEGISYGSLVWRV